MSTGICGKRLGFEEIYGSSSPTACSSVKRPRWSSFGSPSRSDFVSGSDDYVWVLLQMFPFLDVKFVETVLRDHSNRIADAIEALRTLPFGDVNARNKSESLNSTMLGNCPFIPDPCDATCSQMSQERVEEVQGISLTIDHENMMEGSKWVDMFVQEMINATGIDDARGRAARILEAFEQNITANSKATEELDHATLRQHLQSLLNDNHILKRAVAIQHERSFEQEEKLKEVQQLRHVLGQYQEQVQTLEISNYRLKLHLQRAQDSCCIPGQFHPDIF